MGEASCFYWLDDPAGAAVVAAVTVRFSWRRSTAWNDRPYRDSETPKTQFLRA